LPGLDVKRRSCRSAVVSAAKAIAQNALAPISSDESETSGFRDDIRAGREKNREKVRSLKYEVRREGGRGRRDGRERLAKAGADARVYKACTVRRAPHEPIIQAIAERRVHAPCSTFA